MYIEFTINKYKKFIQLIKDFCFYLLIINDKLRKIEYNLCLCLLNQQYKLQLSLETRANRIRFSNEN